jgi:hypothetical protein
MRQSVFGTLALALSLGGVVHPTTQALSPDASITIAAQAGGRAAVVLERNEFYINGPMAGVGQRPLPCETEPPSLMFVIRAWKEGQKARVVVYASLRDKRAPDGVTETPIATFLLARGEKRDVPEAEKWGGPPVTVSAPRSPR